MFILSQFFHLTEVLRIRSVPGTLFSSGGSTVAKLKGPCPCGADLLVEKKASNQTANQRNKTMSGGDAHDMRTTKATQVRCSFCFVFRLDSVLPALLGSVL